MARHNRYSPTYYAYTFAVGAAGLGLLAFSTGVSDVFGAGFSWRVFVALALLALMSKFLSFKLMGLVTLTMDTAIYIAAALVLGPVPAAWAAFISGGGHVLWETLVREARRGGERRPFPENVIFPIFQGGSGALALLLPCFILPVDAFVSGALDTRVDVLWLAPTLAVLFLLIQYLLVLQKYKLLGSSWRTMFEEVMIPGLRAEILVIPLAMVMASVYHSEGEPRVGFWLLCATYVVLNVMFKQMSDATRRASDKIEELRSFSALGRSLCATLQAPALVPLLAEKTLEMIPSAEWCLLYIWNDDLGRFDTLRRFRGGGGVDLEVEARGVELAHRVTVDKIPFSSGALPRGRPGETLQGEAAARLPGSWMGIPVTGNSQIIGVIVVFSYTAGRFGPTDFSILETVGQQATIALQNARLYVLSTVDDLTRLYVRRYFDGRLREEVARSRRYGTRFTLLLIDFDGFKEINDTYGHATGDRVLKRVADLLQKEVRSLDIPARVGGDEFAVILPEVGWQGARLLAERFRERLRTNPVEADGKQVFQTVSMGVASFPDHATGSEEELFKTADAALYRAKQAGRNQVRVAGDEEQTDGMDAESTVRLGAPERD
ncbi:MAG: sensor domain-containing diguanylate cyclase [Pseudomonadota bacterium]